MLQKKQHRIETIYTFVSSMTLVLASPSNAKHVPENVASRSDQIAKALMLMVIRLFAPELEPVNIPHNAQTAHRRIVLVIFL